MRSFAEILDIAADRKGGVDAVLSGMPPVLTPAELAAIPDDRWLAQMARGIFQAGISWEVVKAKWDGIGAAFQGFAPARVAMIEGEALDALLADRRVIRSGAKIVAIRDNAVALCRLAEDESGFGRMVGDWPPTDFVGLLARLSRDFNRLGGSTGPYMLRAMGCESFILSSDVLARLTEEGVIDGPATSARALARVQAAFNDWRAESGQSLTVISRVLAKSIG